MAKDNNTYSDALVGKDVPILFKDQKWQDLFLLSPKTAKIKQLEAELIKLVAKQEKTREKIKDVKRLKKKLLGEIVVLRDDADKNPKQRKKIEAEIERASKMLANPGFINKAPAAKIQEEREKLEKYREMLKKFED